VVPLFRKLIAEGAKELPVTDQRMTRFWITLQQGVEFVLKSFERMSGGELFIPKLPSIRIVDLVKAMAPSAGMRDIGLRPGEMLHEVMCPAGDSHLTLEFQDHYVICPTITFYHHVDFARNALGERGEPVPGGFEYESGSNPQVLSLEQIRALNAQS
jgi:UDP-N-acetylglucosamine 4,6-dehydratase